MAKTSALAFLALDCELIERDSAIEGIGLIMARQRAYSLKLRYVRKSKRMMGFSLWDVLTPIPGYPKSNKVNGYPTLSLEGLKERGLI
jgi:hypothetical protein